MANQGEEDLVASKTEGFKLGDKKTVEEYAKLGEPKTLGSRGFLVLLSLSSCHHRFALQPQLTCLRPERRIS